MTGVAASEAGRHRPDTRISRKRFMQTARQLLEA
jgi:hypothetical protein